MYYCADCGCEFETADVCKEVHSFTEPPYEEVLLCPVCKNATIRAKTVSYCRCCGAKVSGGEKEYCSPSCRKKGEEMHKLELKKKRQMYSSPLFETVREVDEYNKINRTDYSYGQYVTLIKPYINRRKRKKN